MINKPCKIITIKCQGNLGDLHQSDPKYAPCLLEATKHEILSKYPRRKCKSLHICKVCGGRITLDQEYFDGGVRNRHHVECDPMTKHCVEKNDE